MWEVMGEARLGSSGQQNKSTQPWTDAIFLQHQLETGSALRVSQMNTQKMLHSLTFHEWEHCMDHYLQRGKTASVIQYACCYQNGKDSLNLLIKTLGNAITMML